MSANGVVKTNGCEPSKDADPKVDRHTVRSYLGRDGALPPYRYSPKHHWALKLNFMSGITLVPWIVFLIRHGRSIDWRTYPHRVLFLSFMAVINTLLSLFDWLFFSAAVSAQPLHPEPLFILGHPRSGTTLLHNLLATDPRFAFATTFHAGFPSSFLTLEPARGLLAGLLEKRRPMDHMALHWDLPAEDEIAVNVLTGGDSPYLALVLPRLWRSLLRNYLTFGSAAGEAAAEAAAGAGETVLTERAAAAAEKSGSATTMTTASEPTATATDPRVDAVAEEEAGADDPRVTAAFRRWLAAFTWFMKKVTYRHVRSRRHHHHPPHTSSPAPASPPAPPLLIKSPVHTARLGIWRRLFPRARYIYVHRHPLEVFQSAANMADTYYWYTYLQRPTDNVTNDFIMDQYDILYRSYMSERSRVPPGRLVEVGFSELESDPLGVLRRAYHQFGWDEQYEALEPQFKTYVASLADFKKNHFNSLSPQAEAVVRQRWAESFRGLGYPT